MGNYKYRPINDNLYRQPPPATNPPMARTSSLDIHSQVGANTDGDLYEKFEMRERIPAIITSIYDDLLKFFREQYSETSAQYYELLKQFREMVLVKCINPVAEEVLSDYRDENIREDPIWIYLYERALRVDNAESELKKMFEGFLGK